MVTVKPQTALLPPASVTRQFTMVVPFGKAEPLAKPLVRINVTAVQLSETRWQQVFLHPQNPSATYAREGL